MGTSILTRYESYVDTGDLNEVEKALDDLDDRLRGQPADETHGAKHHYAKLAAKERKDMPTRYVFDMDHLLAWITRAEAVEDDLKLRQNWLTDEETRFEEQFITTTKPHRQRYWHKRKDGVRQRYWHKITRTYRKTVVEQVVVPIRELVPWNEYRKLYA